MFEFIRSKPKPKPETKLLTCAHGQIQANRNKFGANEPVSSYIFNTPECSECNLLLRIVEAHKPGWINRRNNDGLTCINIGSEIEDGPLIIHLLLGPSSSSWYHESWNEGTISVDSFEFLSAVTEDEICQGTSRIHYGNSRSLFKSLDIISDSSSKPAFDRANKWLKYCLDHNKKCKISNSAYLPRRLVSVGSENRNPFLFEPNESLQYVCLSYCWGSDSDGILKTTKENMKSLYDVIPLD
ncbi:hypothetical protein G7Y89_g9212 [Cudoniella acicularis]|uniref:Heterokaryon incompatibility domain-containing protein n=1 Tax=Cudoniella acicularis TaxID=354080 RepID=A0A8H4RGM7_9HELO|nr:hypothetical protein G7Y89_g9212 [Cudoniella acicularis]